MRPPRGRLAAFAGLLAATWAGSGPSLWAAGTKADGSGNIRITDDLVNGTAGSVGLTGVGGLELSGTIGQTAAGQAAAASTSTEAGYFSRGVLPPLNPFFLNVYSSSLTVNWFDSLPPNPPGAYYDAVVSSRPDFATLYPGPAFTGVFTSTFTGLQHDTTYYFRVRANYMEGDESAFTAVISTRTRPETEPPTITDNQLGDNAWRRTPSGAAAGSYNVDFADTGGSFLSHFAVKASTTANDPGNGVTGGYQDVVNPGALAGLSLYDANWELPAPIFNMLLDGSTHYMTVKVFDGAGNSTFTVDAFYVRKDTTLPTIPLTGIPNTEETAWRKSDPGPIYDVDFFDSASGLHHVQYSAWTGPSRTGTNVLDWTDIVSSITLNGALSYTADWAVNFATLLDGATNYISVRAWDLAGSTSQVVDRFKILKDTSPPVAAITDPASLYRSSLIAIAGTAFDVQPLAGVEVSITRDPQGAPTCWDGSLFTVICPSWRVATTVGNSWSYSTTPISWANAVKYQVVARSSDSAGNYSTTYATFTFIMDNLPPLAGITSPPQPPPDPVLTSLATISGTSADPNPGPEPPAGISTVEIRLRRNTDNLWWNFFSETAANPWQATEVSSSAALGTPPTWNFGPSPYLQAHLKSGATYFITVRANDNAVPSNSGVFMSANSTFSFLDNTAPAQVTDLQASSTSLPGELKLTWTARGDDGASGYTLYNNPEEMFRIYYATFSFGVGPTTASAQVVIQSTSPTLVTLVVPGTLQTKLIALADGTTYYAAVWQRDNEGNWSVMSNVSNAATTPIPPNKILGHVVNASTQGITGVTVEAFDTAGTLKSTAFTLNDGSGSYALDGLPPASYKVQVAWTANGITSSVWKDNIPMGSRDVDFVLEVTYTLGTISGQIQSMAVSGGTGGGGYTVSSAYEVPGSGAYVELYQNGRRVAKGGVEPDGRFAINNLLPGQYSVRAFNGLSFTEMIEVSLLEGENHDVTFVWDPLPEKSVFAFPNPARKSVVFRFETNLSPLEAQIAVFDIAGNLVREIPGGEMNSPKPGLYHADWNLANAKGEAVASGVYLFMVKVKNTSNGQTSKVVKKLAVIR